MIQERMIAHFSVLGVHLIIRLKTHPDHGRGTGSSLHTGPRITRTKIQRVFDSHTRAGAGQQMLAIGNPLRCHTTQNVKHMRLFVSSGVP